MLDYQSKNYVQGSGVCFLFLPHSVGGTKFVLFFLFYEDRRLNNNSLSGTIPKSLTAITALQVL
jgi:hypothetical protein